MSRQVGIIYNPISGSGESKKAACALEKQLKGAGFGVLVEQTLPDYREEQITAFLNSITQLVIAGGDGSLRGLLPFLVKTSVAIAMLPTGNKSLFASQFGMNRDFNQVLARLNNGKTEQHFVPTVNGHPFFSMVSIGFDSVVVNKLSLKRNGPVSDWSYAAPIFSSLLNHQAPRLSLTVDGKEVISEEEGFLIIGNNRQYAFNLPLVPEADSSRQELVARFFPYRSSLGFARLIAKAFLSPNALISNSTAHRGLQFQVKVLSPSGFPFQADGDSVEKESALVLATDCRLNVLNCRDE